MSKYWAIFTLGVETEKTIPQTHEPTENSHRISSNPCGSTWSKEDLVLLPAGKKTPMKSGWFV